MGIDSSFYCKMQGNWPSIQEFKGKFKKLKRLDRIEFNVQNLKAEPQHQDQKHERPRVPCSVPLAVHLSDELKCLLCTSYFDSRDDLHCHLQGHFRGPPFRCCDCGLIVVSAEALRDHVDTQHRKGRVCEICAKRFCRRKELKQHMQATHCISAGGDDRRFGPIVCCVCQEDFYTMGGLNRHVLALHASRVGPFQCRKCPITFQSESSRDSHFLFAHTNWSTAELLKLHVLM